MWARVKLNSQKIMENYFKSSSSSPQTCSSQKVFTFFEEHPWDTVSGVSLTDFFKKKMVKWQKSNGEQFQMFQKQSASGVYLKRCLSHCKNYTRTWVSIFCIFPYKDIIVDSVLIRENTGQRKPVVWHNLGSVLFEKHIWETASGVSFGDCFWKNGEIAEK